MAASLLQERATSDAATASTLALAFLSNVVSGSAIHVFFSYDHGAGVIDTVTDSQSNSYTLLERVDDTSSGQFVGHYYAVAGSSGALTVTLNTLGGQDYRSILIREIGGVAASPLDGHNGNFQSAPGTGTDACVSGTAANAASGLMSACCYNGNVNGPANAGTGFTAGITGWDFALGTGDGVRSEHKSVSATTQQATFTATQSSPHTSLMAMFKDAAGGGGSITPPIAWLRA